MSVPLAAFPARAFAPSAPAAVAADPFPDLPAGLGGRLDAVCLRALHHPLEYEELYRLLAALRAKAPAATIHLHLRSALGDLAPFRALPADEIEWLTERRGRGAWAEGLRRLRRRLPPGSTVVLLGGPAAWRSLLPGAAAAAPLTFRSSEGVDNAGRKAGEAFRTALLRAAPRWRVRAGSPERIELADPGGPAPRFLIHQARFHVGDALWLTPLAAALRHRFPCAAVTVVAPRTAAPVLADNPHVTDLLFAGPGDPFPARDVLDFSRLTAALFAFARRPESRALAEAAARAGVPYRVNLEYFDPYLDDGEPAAPFTHEGWIFWGMEASPRSLLRLLEPFGGLAGFPPDSRVELPVPPEAHAEAAAFLAEAGLTGRFAVLAPGGRSSDRWPPERFAELGGRLAAEGLGIILSGSPSEAGLLQEIAAAMKGAPAVIFTGALDTLAALLARAALLIANDSAPIHLAEAMATPTLYFAQREKLAHSHPRHTPCWALYDEGANDLRRISVEAVIGAVRTLLELTRR